jgi:gliding motility-associated-like protein
MTRKNLLLTMVILMPALGWGQMVISGSGTTPTYFVVNKDVTTIAISGSLSNQSINSDFSKAALILKGTTGTVNSALTTSAPLDVYQLTVDAGNNYDVIGNWTINSDLTLTNGNLIIDGTSKTSKLVYTGSNEISTGSNDSYVYGPMFIRSSATSHTFPIGDDKGYAPVRLDNLDTSVDTNVELGFDIAATVSGFTTTGSIKEISNARYWQFSVTGGTFPGSSISIGYDTQTESFQDSPSILELSEDTKIQKDLGGKVNNGFFSSLIKTSGVAGYYALAKSDVVRISVHKLITPDDDGKNDVLYIDGIDAYPENRVTILDRWGVPFKKWDKSFVNYTLPANSSQPLDGIDYRSLAVGNYIVIVEYTELGKKKNIQQMISVLK